MKKFAIVFLLFLCLSLAACNTNQGKPGLAPDPDKLPSLDAFHNLSEEEKSAVEDIIVNISSEDFKAYFEKKAVNYLSENHKEMSDIFVDVYQDTLIMKGGKNEKPFNNYFMKLEATFDGEGMSAKEFDDMCAEINTNIFKHLAQDDILGYFKFKELNINFMDNSSNLSYAHNSSKNLSNSRFKTPQSPEELEAQTLAFDFSQERESWLKRFGIMPETEELYVEISRHETPANREDFILELPKMGQELFDAIKSSDACQKYISDNGAKTLTVSFDVPWNADNRYITQNYTLE